MTGRTVTIGISDPTSISFSLGDISVTVLGSRCISPTGTLASFTCQLPANSDGNAAVPAGQGLPLVHIGGIGYADTTTVTPIQYQLTATSVDPSVTSPGGGVIATLSGSGFPLQKTEDLSIVVCGNVVTNIQSVSNTKI